MSEKSKSTGLYQALCEFQAELQSIERSSTVDFMNKEGRRKKYDYVDLAAALDYVLPKLSKHKLVLTTSSVYDRVQKVEVQKRADGTEVTTTQIVKVVHGIEASLTHADSGESIHEVFFFDQEAKDIKDIGAQMTYKRRYAIFTLLCLSAKGEDDDAGSGGQPKPRPEQQPSRVVPPAPNKAVEDKKKAQAEIKKQFDDYGFTANQIETLHRANLTSMQQVIAKRQNYPTNEAMLADIIGKPEGDGL